MDFQSSPDVVQTYFRPQDIGSDRVTVCPPIFRIATTIPASILKPLTPPLLTRRLPAMVHDRRASDHHQKQGQGLRHRYSGSKQNQLI